MTSTPAPVDQREFIGRLQHNRLFLSRTLTRMESGRDSASILKTIDPALGGAYVIGITGPPGSGKSTLVNALIGELRVRSHLVAVIAIDPSSPISGGSILGDRLRMGEHASDDGVFVRSVASGGQSGGLALSTSRLIDVFDAAGFDIVIVETVGAGQAEVEIADLAHATVVLCAPGLGDDIQAIKAGILEIADILVVNKGDLPLANTTVKQLKAALSLRRDRQKVPVLTTTATTKTGIDELTDSLFHLRTDLKQESRASPHRIKRLLARRLGHALERQLLGQQSTALTELCSSIQRGDRDMENAVEYVMNNLHEFIK